MDKITKVILNGDSVSVQIIGKVDSSNSAQLENELEEIRSEQSCDIIIDAKLLEYISSAGLRVLLKIRKQQQELEIKNVNPAVYDVLDITGFTQLLKVRKAMREISVDGCEIIGKGGNGTVYKLDDETIVKLYGSQTLLSEIEREQEYSKKAFVNGIPTAIPFDIVTCGGCYGLVYEMFHADTLGGFISKHPEQLDEYVEKYAALLKTLHTTELPQGTLASSKDFYLSLADEASKYYTPEEITRIEHLIECIPDRNTIMHGDFHPKNILVQNGELVLIDMADITQGHPIFDFAGIYLILVSTARSCPDITLEITGLTKELALTVWNKLVSIYFSTNDPEIIDVVNSQSNEYRMIKYALASVLNKNIPENMIQTLADGARAQFFPIIDKMTADIESGKLLG